MTALAERPSTVFTGPAPTFVKDWKLADFGPGETFFAP